VPRRGVEYVTYSTSSLLLASKATSKPPRCTKRGANRVSPAPRSGLPGVEVHDVLDGQPLGRTEVSAVRVLDANETSWAFVAVYAVGSVKNLLVSVLAALALIGR
jgi:hypothetical protein